jgi:hypothetical protein
MPAARAAMGRDLCHDVEDERLRERLHVRHPAGKRDHLGTRRKGDQRPNL